MDKNIEITKTAEEILSDLTNFAVPLHIVMLKAAKLALIVDLPENYQWLINNAKSAESSEATKSSFQIKIESAKDPSISIASANPNENIGWSLMGKNNSVERSSLSNEYTKAINWIAFLRNETFKFVLNIYNKWKFGNIAESIFENKRSRIEPVLLKILPDFNQRLNSITQNLNSDNSEDWKNAVGSCRALFMDIADVINPAQKDEDKPKYMNRIKDFISPKISLKSKTKEKLIDSLFEELKNRIEFTLSMNQGGSHSTRPELEYAKDVILYTYLSLAEIAEVYLEKENPKSTEIPVPTIELDKEDDRVNS